MTDRAEKLLANAVAALDAETRSFDVMTISGAEKMSSPELAKAYYSIERIIMLRNKVDAIETLKKGKA